MKDRDHLYGEASASFDRRLGYRVYLRQVPLAAGPFPVLVVVNVPAGEHFRTAAAPASQGFFTIPGLSVDAVAPEQVASKLRYVGWHRAPSGRGHPSRDRRGLGHPGASVVVAARMTATVVVVIVVVYWNVLTIV